jgi:hypothetical protein
MVDVGLGQPVPLKTDEINLAFISAGLEVPVGAKSKEILEELTAEMGIPMKTFDPQLDPVRQHALYETVVGSGEINAIITLPVGASRTAMFFRKQPPKRASWSL